MDRWFGDLSPGFCRGVHGQPLNHHRFLPTKPPSRDAEDLRIQATMKATREEFEDSLVHDMLSVFWEMCALVVLSLLRRNSLTQRGLNAAGTCSISSRSVFFLWIAPPFWVVLKGS